MARRKATGKCIVCGRQTDVTPVSGNFTVVAGICDQCKEKPHLRV